MRYPEIHRKIKPEALTVIPVLDFYKFGRDFLPRPQRRGRKFPGLTGPTEIYFVLVIS